MTDKPKRRWFRFSLRTMLLVTGLLSSLLAYVTNSSLFREMDTTPPSHSEIVAAIQQNGFQLPAILYKSYSTVSADFVDAPYRFPIVGWFQRRHRHYKCYLYSKDINRPIVSVAIKDSHTRWLYDLSNRY